MEYESLPPDAKFLFMATMQACLKAKEAKMNRETFMEFVSECWETMLINDAQELAAALQSSMLKDIEKFTRKKWN